MKAYFSILILGFIITSCGAQIILSDKKFEAEGIENVKVEGSFVNIYLESINGKAVDFDGWIKGPKKYQGGVDIESRLEGTTLIIFIERPNSMNGNFSGEFRIGIPDKVGVNVKNSSGNLLADGLNGEEISLRCSSGNLDAKNIKGNIYLKSSSGNISARFLEGNTSAISSSGNLKIENQMGNLDCRSSSGRIYLTDIKQTNLTAESTSGGVALQNVSGKLEIETSSGSIRGENVKLEGDSFFESSSGAINIGLENDVNEISFDLKSSSGSLRVNGNRSDERLIIKRGGIQVHGRSSSGSQSYFN